MFYSRPCPLRLPIISSDYDGSSDIIKNNYNGIIYKIKSDKDLLEKMQYLASSKNLIKKLTDNGFYYVKKYDLSEVSKQWIKLFNKTERLIK